MKLNFVCPTINVTFFPLKINVFGCECLNSVRRLNGDFLKEMTCNRKKETLIKFGKIVKFLIDEQFKGTLN